MNFDFLKTRLTKLITLVFALILLGIYYRDVKNDYYFYTSKKQTGAVVKELKKVKAYMPFILTLSYYNDFVRQDRECVIKLDGHYGKELSESLPDRIQIFYTRQRPSDVYIIDYKYPTKAAMALRLIIFGVLFIGSVIFAKQLFRKGTL